MARVAAAAFPPEAQVSVGSVIREARARKGYSQSRLGELTNIAPNSIAKYERAGEPGGQMPPLDKALALCSVLGIDPRAFIDELMGAQSGARPAPADPDAERRARLAEIIRLEGGVVHWGGERPANLDDPLEEPAEAEEASPLEELAAFVTERGLAARGVPAMIAGVEANLELLDPDELRDEAERAGVDLADCPAASELAELEPKAVDAHCASLTDRLLMVALYPDDPLAGFSDDGLERLRQDVAETFGSSRRAGTARIYDEPVKPRDSFLIFDTEEAEAYRARLLRELPHFVVLAVKERTPFDLADAERYPRQVVPAKRQR